MKSRLFQAFLLAGVFGLAGSAYGKDQPSAEATEEKSLSDLSERLQKILELQTAVNHGTKTLHKAIQDTQAARKLAARQQDIVNQASKTITLLEEGGSMSAFTEVLQRLREDMKIVQSRLAKYEVNDTTQALEEDIITTTKEMIAALKNH
jgi:DNA polymerase III epsilon subunit-like protein